MRGTQTLMAVRQFFENAVRSAAQERSACCYCLARFQPKFLGGISGILLNSFASHCELDYGGKNETKTDQIEQ